MSASRFSCPSSSNPSHTRVLSVSFVFFSQRAWLFLGSSAWMIHLSLTLCIDSINASISLIAHCIAPISESSGSFVFFSVTSFSRRPFSILITFAPDSSIFREKSAPAGSLNVNCESVLDTTHENHSETTWLPSFMVLLRTSFFFSLSPRTRVVTSDLVLSFFSRIGSRVSPSSLDIESHQSFFVRMSGFLSISIS